MSIKLVIADDAPFIREVIKQIAHTHDFEVVGEAENGNVAVELALNLRPDVVIMDVVMPLKNGAEATREIIQAWPEAKVIACTTVDQEEVITQVLQAGCCDFILKPFTSEKLVGKIKKAHGVVEEQI